MEGAPHTPSGPLARAESGIAGAALILMVLLPLAEMAARPLLGRGIPGSGPFTQHLTLWVGFLGAAIAASEGRLLALATTGFLPQGRIRRSAEIFAAAVAAGIATLLCRAGIGLAMVERESGGVIALGVKIWVAQLVIPLSFGLIALRLVWRASPSWTGRTAAALGIVAGLVLGQFPQWLEGRNPWPGAVLVLLGTALGAPIFVLLGGVAVLLFMKDGVPIAAMPVETYRLAVHPTLAAIPLFTFTGFLLSEGQAATRLLRVFRALVGWIPGGTAVVCAAVCAFFTAFTGGSGVTILALGALLFKALRSDGYRDRFSLGLLTSAGSLGLLFPPALPMILYGIVAQIPIENLFIGGFIPGVLMVALLAGWGVREGLASGAGRTAFSLRELGAALWEGKWELALPVVVLVAIFGGWATLVEASALTALYALVVECFVLRDLSARRDLPRVLHQSVVLVGGVLVILGVAMGLTSYMVDAQVPEKLVGWTQAHVHSRWVFLLALNVFLLVVGCLMDIFSAIVVVVPLIVPIGAAFGIHPVHLGIIFIANLELGYLTPPVGLNLFLASYRFHKPILEVTRAALPMLAILGLGVLVITYWPALTTGLLLLMGKS
jgi:C4-dicarboxylate transporter, DctM subunit